MLARGLRAEIVELVAEEESDELELDVHREARESRACRRRQPDCRTTAASDSLMAAGALDGQAGAYSQPDSPAAWACMTCTPKKRHSTTTSRVMSIAEKEKHDRGE